jgi:preprotein translocase subunit SecE
MAEDKLAKDTKKTGVPKLRKPSSSMRESAAQSRARAEKPKRVRKAASAAKKPVSSLGAILTKEYHLIEPKDQTKFFTKSRSITPRFLSSAWSEMRQVTWPKRKETWRLVFAVFVFAITLGVLIAVLDYGLEKLLREVIL